MRRVKQAVVVAIIGATLLGLVPLRAIGAPLADCLPPYNLQIHDMGIIPDPVPQGQPIRAWTVRLQSGYTTECLTVLEVIELLDQDQNSLITGKRVPYQIAGAKVQYRITPGAGSYTFSPAPNYASLKGEHYCFMVVVDVQDTLRPISTIKSFCPRLVPGGWSLR